MSPFASVYVIVGGFISAFHLFSLLFRNHLLLNEVLLGTVFGIFVGPQGLGVFDPRSWAGSRFNDVTHEIMRIVLAADLFAIGVELPGSYMAQHARGLLIMVVPTMAVGWMIVGFCIRLLLPQLDWPSCLTIAACLTPTDPVICSSIVGGKFATENVPRRIRHILSAESAANDGLAFPFLTISMSLVLGELPRKAFIHWLWMGWLYQVALGTLAGSLIGYLFSSFMRRSLALGFIDRESYVAQCFALALFTVGSITIIGSDDLLAVFAAGSAISWDQDFNKKIENTLFSSVLQQMLNCACFIYLGATLSLDIVWRPSLGVTPWTLVTLGAAILILRRIPAILFLYRWVPEISGWKEALFTGHFGPVSQVHMMGVGAVFMATMALEQLPHPHDPPEGQQEILADVLRSVIAFVVLASIVIHGLSISFFTLYKKVQFGGIESSSPFERLDSEWLRWLQHHRPQLNDNIRAPGPVSSQRVQEQINTVSGHRPSASDVD
ncbi:Sodium/hydrogen exchanger [Pluteus cervinus]|uniref:Sodium/hydrogen exchanger n=1 Tax=Pluteus cervinus TaxID=181527 RepID=A0ACD3BBR6_9AGAR|nr:Sodium/hydrogen exchanger [Pluteus cervinus]